MRARVGVPSRNAWVTVYVGRTDHDEAHTIDVARGDPARRAADDGRAWVGSNPGETAPDVTRDATVQSRSAVERWEFTLDGQVGAPIGWLRVGEFPPSGGTAGGAPGTRLRLSDAGIHVSETLEGSVALHFPRDAVRASSLYSFLRGESTQDRSAVYNGEEFAPGQLHTNADFSRFSLAYERTLLSSPATQLVGSLGLTYVYFNPTLTSRQRAPSPSRTAADARIFHPQRHRGTHDDENIPRINSAPAFLAMVLLQSSAYT